MDLTNLVSVWELEEASGTRADAVVDSGNDLSDNNTVTQTTGKVGNCALFTGANLEFLSKTSNASLQVSGSFSWAAWINMSTLLTFPLISKWSSTGAAGDREYYLAYVHGYGFNFAIRDSGDTTNYSVIHASGVASTGTWYFVTGVYDASGPNLHVNVNAGTRSTIAGPASPASSDNPLTFGVFDSGTDYIDGMLDQVVFFKRAITTGEETTLYNSGNGLSYADMQPTGAIIPVLMSQYRQRRAA